MADTGEACMDLFAIRDTIKKTVIQTGFSDKRQAKAERDRLNAEHGKGQNPRFTVTYGKDHRKYRDVTDKSS